MSEEMNEVVLQGEAVQRPEQFHNVYGVKNLKTFFIDVQRDSNIHDQVMVLYGEKTEIVTPANEIQQSEKEEMEAIAKAEWLEVKGKLQTWKSKRTGRVQLFVMAEKITINPIDEYGKQFINKATLEGRIVRKPYIRSTPKGRTITDMALEIASIFEKGYCAYIPCIAWEKKAEELATMNEGDKLLVVGRIQERKYIKKIDDENAEERETWEISISHMERV